MPPILIPSYKVTTGAIYGPEIASVQRQVRASRPSAGATKVGRVKPKLRFASPMDALQARLAEFAPKAVSVTETVPETPVTPPHSGDRNCTIPAWEKRVSLTIPSAPFPDRSANRPELVELPPAHVGKAPRNARKTARVARQLWDNVHPPEPIIAAYGISDAQAEYNIEHMWDDKTPMERFEALRIPSERQRIHGPGF